MKLILTYLVYTNADNPIEKALKVEGQSEQDCIVQAERQLFEKYGSTMYELTNVEIPSNKITIYEIYRERDEYGYGCAYNLSDCDKREFKGDYETALVKAGCLLDCNGGLVAIKSEDRGVVFYHYHGATGEVTKLTSVSALRKHLKEKCNGMTLKGRLE